MSRAEVIEAVNAMGKEDRVFLSAYLRAKELSEDPGFVEECSRRLAAMKRGERLSSTEVLELHKALAQKGL